MIKNIDEAAEGPEGPRELQGVLHQRTTTTKKKSDVKADVHEQTSQSKKHPSH